MKRVLNVSACRLVICAALIGSGLFGCATSEDTMQLAKNISATDTELTQYRQETEQRLASLAKEDENIRRQLVNLSSAVDDKNDKIKIIFGKLDELEYQLRMYFNELKTELNALKKPGGTTPETAPRTGQTPAKDYEAAYKDAFDAFQKKSYEESVKKFSAFVDAYPGTPLVPNALYWIGEARMNMKDYEKAVLSFQELVDKYPKSDKVPRALLAQAEAFSAVKDRKSATTVLKKVIELFPKSEEAAIAERRLRN